MSVGKGSNTTTSQTGPAPQAAAAYNSLLDRASGVASTPYQAYSGELVAPLNAQQQTGVGAINQSAGFASPYISQAANYANQAATPLTAADIAKYQSPYTQSVVDATQAQFNNQNAQQQNALKGNAAAQGALGGNRVGVAQAQLAGQQSLAQAPVIAGLYNTGYNQATGVAQQQQQNLGQAAYSLGNLGVAGQNAALTGAGAQLGAGTLEQQIQQAQDTAQYGQFQTQQAFPYQQTQWLAGIDTGVGSQLGGTSSTTPPPPNAAAQYLGLGLSAAGMFLAHGGRIPGFDSGGGISGTPYAGVQGYVPTIGIKSGRGAPDAPKAGVGNTDLSAIGKGLGSLQGAFGGSGGNPLSLSPDGSYYSPTPVGGFEPIGSAGELNAGLGAIYKRGGFVDRLPNHNRIEMRRGYDSGGIVQAGFGTPLSFDDRWGDYPSAVTGGVGNRLDRGDLDVVNPGDPIQDVDRSSMAAWRAGVDQDRGAGQSAQPIDDAPTMPAVAANDLPPEITGGTSRPQAGVGAPAGLMAYDGSAAPTAGFAEPMAAPTGSPGGAGGGDERKTPGMNFGLGYLSPAAKAGFLAAGLGMLASKSPNLGNAIGEGGLAGLGAYGAQQKTEQEAANTKITQGQANRRIDLEAQRLSNAAETARKTLELHTKTAGETADYHQGLLNRDNLKPTGATTAEGHPIMYDTRKPGVALDGITGQPVKPDEKITSAKQPEPSFTGDELKTMARQYNAGDKSVLTNLGRGAQGASDLKALRKAIVADMNEKGISPEAQAVKMAEFQGMTAGQRALGTRTANIEMAANEARNMMKPALDLSEKVNRTNWTPVNRAIQAFESGTSDPDLAAWGAANFSLVNTYVRAIAPTGVPPESAREHALKMLNTAMGKDAYRAVVNQMKIEMDAALASPEQVKDKFRQMYGGQPAAAPAAPIAPAGGTPAVTPAPAAAVPAAAPAASAIPPPDRRQVNQVYQTPKGPYVWTGTGWRTP